jgi:hypothetical protein
VNTKNADRPIRAEDDDIRPDTRNLDWSKAEVGRRARQPGQKSEVFIDGAVGYQLRLIPSNKVLARFETTLEAWPVIIATVEAGPAVTRSAGPLDVREHAVLGGREGSADPILD